MNRLRFTRQQRLTQPKQYQLMFADSKRVGSKAVCVLCRANQLEESRLGMVVPRKFIRRALDRNRIKRQIRESFRAHQQALQGIDIVVWLRADVSSLSNLQLRQQLQQNWQQAIQKCVNF